MSALPTFMLFSKHLSYNSDGTVNVSKLISSECYKEWLQSRKLTPMLPEESFRKALTCHVKGSVGMKPFVVEVEKEIIKMLAVKEIWPCFRENPNIKIGERGCTVSGYWSEQESHPNKRPLNHREQIGVNEILPIGSYQNPNSALKVMKFHKKTKFSLIPMLKTGFDIYYLSSRLFLHNERMYGRLGKPSIGCIPPDVFQKILTSRPSMESPSGLLENLVIEASNSMRSDHDSALQDDDDRLSVVSEKSTSSKTGFLQSLEELMDERDWVSELNDVPDDKKTVFILKLFQKAMFGGDSYVMERIKATLKFLPDDQIYMFVVTLYKHTKFSSLFPETVPNMSAEGFGEEIKTFFDKDFCIPRKNERHFRADRPIGVCLGDFATYTIVDVDEACKEIYRGSIVGAHSISLRVHKIQGTLFLYEHLSELFLAGEIWSRSVEYRCDGTVMVSLNRYVIVDLVSNSVRVEIQDVTDDYLHLL